MQQWLLLILESLPAINLLNAWRLLFDLFPEPIWQPEDLGKSQRAHAEESVQPQRACSLLIFPCRSRHTWPAQTAASCPLPMLSSSMRISARKVSQDLVPAKKHNRPH